MYGIFEPTEGHLARLKTWFDDVVVARDEASAIEAARNAEIILGHRYLRQSLPGARRLRWVQTTAGGVDRLPCLEMKAAGVTLTRVTFTAPSIARHAVTMAWSFNRALFSSLADQTAGKWNTEGYRALPQPKHALVFGTGAIGKQIARCLKADGIAVHGIKKSVCGDKLPDFDSIHSLAEAEALLPKSDWCFLALPTTPQTDGWFNAKAIAALPRHAVLVNVGRGSTIVTADLCDALNRGQLGGAALDVLDPYPPKQDDPIWRVPRLLITAHVAARYEERAADMEAFSEAQAERFATGKPLENVVDFNAAL